MFLLSPVARSQQKDHLKHASWEGAREEIASADDGGWSQNQLYRKVEMGTGT